MLLLDESFIGPVHRACSCHTAIHTVLDFKPQVEILRRPLVRPQSTMPSSSAHCRDRPRQERRRSSSWSHSYRRKSQVSSSHYSEDDDSAYLSGSASDNSSAGESESEVSVEHDNRRRDHTKSHRSSHRDDERRSRKNRHNKEEPRSRTKKTLDRESDDDDEDEDDAITTIARLKEQLAEAKTTNAKLETKAEKQDKAIKFLFKDNDQLKRKLEESSSRSQGKALRDLCDRNDRLDAENRQLRERYAALAVKANGGSEYAPNNTTTTSSSATRSTACSSSPGSPGLDPSPVQPTQAPAPAIHRVASRRRNSSPPKRQSPIEPQQPPPIAALPRPASSRRRHSMLGNGVREIPTSMLQAPPPEFDPDQHKHNGFGGDGLREEDDPILGKTFSVNTGPSPSSMADMAKNAGSVTKKRISRRRASMFT